MEIPWEQRTDAEFGLIPGDLAAIRRILSSFPAIDRAAIFGSRALGTSRKGSDIDLAIFGPGIDFDVVAGLKAQLEEKSPLPYTFDVVDRTHLAHAPLATHIDTVGQEIYTRG